MDRLASITALVRVAENGGFSAAARSLNVSTGERNGCCGVWVGIAIDGSEWPLWVDPPRSEERAGGSGIGAPLPSAHVAAID
jgi:hypothetical protein